MTDCPPGLLVAAPRSGSGKTTVTLGLQRALARKGLRVRGVKCGPDYIDPAFHAAATGAPSFNLDSFAMEPPLLAAILRRAGADADLVIGEGSMGLFDGIRGEAGRTGASADVAALFGWPVLLVLDVSGHAQSAAAVALGCARFDPRIRVAGVVLNKVASDRHRTLVEEGLARIDMPVLGALTRDGSLTLPERHLGLVQAGETTELDRHLDRLADAIERSLDLDRIVALAGAARAALPGTPKVLPPPGQRIALAFDTAFSFVYPHVLEGWRAAGAEIRTFSPLADEPPPAECDTCWLPGGYPELHAERLANAGRFLEGLRRFARTGTIHGECGGYMVLGRSIEDGAGRTHRMADLLPVDTSIAKRKLHLGYRVARLFSDGPLGAAGDIVVGHEFHYSSVVGSDHGDATCLAAISDAEGRDLGRAGHRCGLVSGSFFHVIATRATSRATSAAEIGPRGRRTDVPE
jgi:cobyrinic acid a,c-diamide synthase